MSLIISKKLKNSAPNLIKIAKNNKSSKSKSNQSQENTFAPVNQTLNSSNFNSFNSSNQRNSFSSSGIQNTRAAIAGAATAGSWEAARRLLEQAHDVVKFELRIGIEHQGHGRRHMWRGHRGAVHAFVARAVGG